MATVTERYEQARQTLAAAGQEHVLQYWPQLSDEQRIALLDQIDSVDWPELARLVVSHVRAKPEFKLPQDVQPAPWYPHVPTADLADKYEQAKQRGWELINGGKVAAFTVAGGQGTRLGWDAPKGTFPATPIRKLSLFGCFAQYIQNIQQRSGVVIPWYVMTSPINDAATRDFFKDHRWFGLERDQVLIFPQAMMPALDTKSGRVLLESPGALALSPNGHGGSLKALWSGGAIADAKRRGIEHLSYVQVDNPVVRVLDPLFIGLHDLDGAEMSSKMLPKREPMEKLGNFCLADGKLTVIEYSDLPEALARQTLADGSLRFRAGSIAIHCLRVDFVEKLNTQAGGFALPYHRAEKKVAYFDAATNKTVKPDKPNAVKLETFVFDALPLCDKSIVYETDRVDEFAPIKNADLPAPQVADDSPMSSKLLQIERAARWLEAAGVKVERDVHGKVLPIIELSQITAVFPEDLQGKQLPAAITARQQMLL